MASGRRHDVALPSITIALAEARRLVALAPNRREKNTGIGRATAVFRHDPDVARAPIGQAATVVVRDARCDRLTPNRVGPRHRFCGRNSRRLICLIDAASATPPDKAAASATFDLRARDPQRTEVNRQRREGQQPHHRHRHVHQHRAAIAATAGTQAHAPHGEPDGAADGVVGGHGVRGRGPAALRVPPGGAAAGSPSAAGGGASSSPVGAGRKDFGRVGSGGTSSGSSGRTRRGVISTISSVRSARSDLLLNRTPMIGSLLRIGMAAFVLLRHVVQQARDGERLTVPQLNVGLGAARQERRNAEALKGDAVVEIERADLGLHLEADLVAGDRRLERQPHAELLELDRHRIGGALDDRNRELAAGEEARLLAVVGDQVRLGEALEVALRLERLQDCAEALAVVEEKRLRKSLNTCRDRPRARVPRTAASCCARRTAARCRTT